MFFIIFSLLFLSHDLEASWAELHGSSSVGAHLGGQFSTHHDPAALNYSLPALMALNPKTSISFSVGHMDTNFTEIKDIVLTNETNNTSSTPVTTGDIDPNDSSFQSMSLHGTLKINEVSSLGLSLFAPLNGNMLEIDTGHPFHPEYVMYRSRHKRLQANVNYAHRLFSFSNGMIFSGSLGAHFGLQSTAVTEFNASLEGTGIGSSGRTQLKAKQSLGAVVSLGAQWSENQKTGLAYQQEMKNQLNISAKGMTAQPQIPYNLTMNSLVNYDPHILRLAHEAYFSGPRLGIVASVDYQMWSNYKPALIEVTKVSGTIVSSDNFEKVETKDIFIPKLGISWDFHPHHTLLFGLANRPTPLKGDFSGAGNSIDSDTWIFSVGASHSLAMLGQEWRLSYGLQRHILDEREVNKTEGLENGGAGNKIGGPSYKIGGHIDILSIGIGLVF